MTTQEKIVKNFINSNEQEVLIADGSSIVRLTRDEDLGTILASYKDNGDYEYTDAIQADYVHMKLSITLKAICAIFN